MEIYKPAEDSYLLSGSIKKYLKKVKDKNIKILDMGSGSGILADTCKKLGFSNILTVDINIDAISFLKKKGFSAVRSDLFKSIKKQDFDLILFNPPYLPKDDLEPSESTIITTAGKEGNEIILKFLKEAKPYLSKKGAILLLFSSLSKPEIIMTHAKKLGYKLKLLDKQNLFFETLFVYDFSNDK